MSMEGNSHYQAIEEFYADKFAKRSGVPLINHIKEGVFILDIIGASNEAKEAYCIHPLLQSDQDLVSSVASNSIFLNYDLNQLSVVYAMEYRLVANKYLSHDCKSEFDAIGLSQIKSVNDMLIADKIQNRKDFESYHLGTHEKSDILELYFSNWLKVLSVSEQQYRGIVRSINEKT